MTEPIELQQLQTTAEAPAAGRTAGDLQRLSAIPVEVSVELGRAHMTVGDTLDLHPGSVITLNRMAGEPMDLLVNGTPVARGEIVVVDEQFGLRVTEVLGGGSGSNQAAPSPGAGPAGA
jgi:flagellar motor switch protein FliN/FliY